MKIIIKVSQFAASRLEAFKKAFDIRDVFLFGGMGALGYGLYLLRPWLSFSVCGALLMLLSFMLPGKK